jgi:hypothetical protein
MLLQFTQFSKSRYFLPKLELTIEVQKQNRTYKPNCDKVER